MINNEQIKECVYEVFGSKNVNVSIKSGELIKISAKNSFGTEDHISISYDYETIESIEDFKNNYLFPAITVLKNNLTNT